jgi:hypothetical protein
LNRRSPDAASEDDQYGWYWRLSQPIFSGFPAIGRDFPSHRGTVATKFDRNHTQIVGLRASQR